MITVNASSVASLCGLHPFRSVKGEFQKLHNQNNTTKFKRKLPCEVLDELGISIESSLDQLKEAKEKMKTLQLKERDKSIADQKIRQFEGIKQESHIIKQYEHQTQKKVLSCDVLKQFQISDDITLQGRIDGVTEEDGEIIEIKCRQYCFPKSTPLYDKIQILCYLKMFDKKKAILVEKVSSGEEIRCQDIEWDEDCWKMIENRLSKVKEIVCKLRNKPQRFINDFFSDKNSKKVNDLLIRKLK